MNVAVVTALIAFSATLVAAVIGLYWNFENAKQARKLPFLQKQLEYCFEATELAARLANCDDDEVWNASRARFYELYWGPLAVVEDDAVAGAMINFSEELQTREGFSGTDEKLNHLAYALSLVMRKFLIRCWEIHELQEVLEAWKENGR